MKISRNMLYNKRTSNMVHEVKMAVLAILLLSLGGASLAFARMHSIEGGGLYALSSACCVSAVLIMRSTFGRK